MSRFTPVAFAIVGVSVVLLLWLAPQRQEIVALTIGSSIVSAGSYDSLESPRGTAYVTPTDRTLVISSWVGAPQTAASSDFTIEIGYADSAVADSSTAPAGATVVYATSWRTADGTLVHEGGWIPIPGGKYVFVRPVGGSIVFSATGTVH